jgi:hypothetical protein
VSGGAKWFKVEDKVVDPENAFVGEPSQEGKAKIKRP